MSCGSAASGRRDTMEQSGERPFYTTYVWVYDFYHAPDHPDRGHCYAPCAAGDCSWRAAAGRRVWHRRLCPLRLRGVAMTSPGLICPSRSSGARERAHHARVSCALVCGNLLRLPFAPHYDGVLCRGPQRPARHAESQQVFCAFAWVLRPGGVLLLDVRDWDTTVARSGSNPSPRRRWSRRAAPSPSAV